MKHETNAQYRPDYEPRLGGLVCVIVCAFALVVFGAYCAFGAGIEYKEVDTEFSRVEADGAALVVYATSDGSEFVDTRMTIYEVGTEPDGEWEQDGTSWTYVTDGFELAVGVDAVDGDVTLNKAGLLVDGTRTIEWNCEGCTLADSMQEWFGGITHINFADSPLDAAANTVDGATGRWVNASGIIDPTVWYSADATSRQSVCSASYEIDGASWPKWAFTMKTTDIGGTSRYISCPYGNDIVKSSVGEAFQWDSNTTSARASLQTTASDIWTVTRYTGSTMNDWATYCFIEDTDGTNRGSESHLVRAHIDRVVESCTGEFDLNSGGTANDYIRWSIFNYFVRAKLATTVGYCDVDTQSSFRSWNGGETTAPSGIEWRSGWVTSTLAAYGSKWISITITEVPDIATGSVYVYETNNATYDTKGTSYLVKQSVHGDYGYIADTEMRVTSVIRFLPITSKFSPTNAQMTIRDMLVRGASDEAVYGTIIGGTQERSGAVCFRTRNEDLVAAAKIAGCTAWNPVFYSITAPCTNAVYGATDGNPTPYPTCGPGVLQENCLPCSMAWSYDDGSGYQYGVQVLGQFEADDVIVWGDTPTNTPTVTPTPTQTNTSTPAMTFNPEIDSLAQIFAKIDEAKPALGLDPATQTISEMLAIIADGEPTWGVDPKVQSLAEMLRKIKDGGGY